MKKLYIIIPKFNGEKEIKECLKSLQLIKISAGWEIKVVVVDNSRKIPNFKFQISNKFQILNSKLIKLIKNKKNLGFAGGVNVGIREALKNGAEAVLLLNQDTKVEKDFLSPLLENPADIVGPVIKFQRGGNWVYDYGGRINWWLGESKHWELQTAECKMQNDNSKLKIKSNRGHLGRWPEGTPPRWREIDYISGCAMMVRRRVFEKIGLFDERYFLYFEDADFCLRAKKAGFKIAVEPKSVIVHYLREGKKKPLWQRWEAVKSNFIFINRWICWWKRPLALGFWFLRGIRVLIG